MRGACAGWQTGGGLISIINGASACIFFVLGIWLAAASVPGSVFATWSDTVVLDGTPARNGSMTQRIAGVDIGLAELCGGERMSLPRVRFSLNGSVMDGSVFCTTTPTTYNSKALLGIVLWVSFAFQVWRVSYSTDSLDYSRVAPSESGHAGLSYYIYRPDFVRWLEYTVTSPLQIIVLCGTVYMRNAQQLLLISALQGGLTQCGYTLELCIYHLEIAAKEGGKHSREFSRMSAKLLAVFAGAVYIHCVIWDCILSALATHSGNTRHCDYGMERLPPMIHSVVAVQCACFSLFGCVPVAQTVAIMLARPDSMYRVWGGAAVAYSLLSVVSKGALGVMFVMLVTDGSCINTGAGRACLY